MDVVNFISKMVGITMGNGGKIECMGLVNYIIRLRYWLIRDIGIMINLKELANYIMKYL